MSKSRMWKFTNESIKNKRKSDEQREDYKAKNTAWCNNTVGFEDYSKPLIAKATYTSVFDVNQLYTPIDDCDFNNFIPPVMYSDT